MEKRSILFILVLSVAVVFSMASNCPAPFCGDSVLEEYLGEECDPGTPGSGWAETPDDAACPGQCLPDCTCPDTPTITPATYSPTECQEVVTECPAIATQCSVGAATVTGCPVVPTECMVVATECPAIVTECIDAPTYCPTLSYCGGEGCTPGYWKVFVHLDSWVGYSPNDLFSSVFENAFPGKTLLQVLWQGGGGLKALGRHTVAALLNAANPDVEYGMSAAEVIAAFNEVYPDGDYDGLKMELEDLNEQGCPLN
jgi:hypothetical protein